MPGSWSSSCPTTRGRGSSSLSWRHSGIRRSLVSDLPAVDAAACCCVPASRSVLASTCTPTSPLPPECLLHGVKEGLVLERLGQEVDGTHLHGALGHGNVAVAGDEDYWDSMALGHQHLLQVEPVLPRHADVHYDAAQTVEVPVLQELAR